MRYLIATLITLVISVHAFAVSQDYINLDNRKWVLGWSSPDKSMIFDEYVLKGETVDDWSELLTIQYFPGLNKHTNLDVFEAMQKQSLASVCPAIKWESVSVKQNDRMWKFTFSNCSGQPDQSELARAIKTNTGIHVIHYAIKKSPMPSRNEKAWIEILNKFDFSK